ncbi:hypothetical protein QJS10_CPA02g00394 [Acorus calamus]|uniref:Uncharacterized protein n=1 Tax=Acorus calamus TaxID=4465 RepID=A0AAV9FCK2_ACOCL|nr:hypothetical protein QJS10_CPA02g00394 [Acorus calamus]
MGSLETRSRRVPTKLVFKEGEMQVLVHDVPTDHLTSVSRDDRGNSPLYGLSQLIGGKSSHPAELILGVVPQDVVAADGDPMLLSKCDHRVRERVVFLAGDILRTVPLHLVLKYCHFESRGEPALVGHVVDYGFPNRASKRKPGRVCFMNTVALASGFPCLSTTWSLVVLLRALSVLSIW